MESNGIKWNQMESFEKIETLLAFDVMRFVDGKRSILAETYKRVEKRISSAF